MHLLERPTAPMSDYEKEEENVRLMLLCHEDISDMLMPTPTPPLTPTPPPQNPTEVFHSPLFDVDQKTLQALFEQETRVLRSTRSTHTDSVPPLEKVIAKKNAAKKNAVKTNKKVEAVSEKVRIAKQELDDFVNDEIYAKWASKAKKINCDMEAGNMKPLFDTIARENPRCHLAPILRRFPMRFHLEPATTDLSLDHVMASIVVQLNHLDRVDSSVGAYIRHSHGFRQTTQAADYDGRFELVLTNVTHGGNFSFYHAIEHMCLSFTMGVEQYKRHTMV